MCISWAKLGQISSVYWLMKGNKIVQSHLTSTSVTSKKIRKRCSRIWFDIFISTNWAKLLNTSSSKTIFLVRFFPPGAWWCSNFSLLLNLIQECAELTVNSYYIHTNHWKEKDKMKFNEMAWFWLFQPHILFGLFRKSGCSLIAKK